MLAIRREKTLLLPFLSKQYFLHLNGQVILHKVGKKTKTTEMLLLHCTKLSSTPAFITLLDAEKLGEILHQHVNIEQSSKKETILWFINSEWQCNFD